MAWVDLHSAAACGDLDQLRRHWWLKRFLINKRNTDKLTPLHLACMNGHADVVQFLVGKNCQLNPCDKFKKSPLIQAVEHQHRDCVAILLEHGASHNLRAAGGNTALHSAVMISSESLVELLLEHGADINAKNELGYTPLVLAITERRKEMIKILLQKGADIHAEDKCERTPIAVASIAKNNDAVQIFHCHGAVLKHRSFRVDTAQISTKILELSAKKEREYKRCERMGQSSARGPEGIDSSCSGTSVDIPFNTRALPKSFCILRYQRGVLPAAGKRKKKDDDSPWASEPLVRQLLEKLDEVLKKKSLAETSLGAMETHSRDLREEKLLLQEKLERSKAKMQELKEHCIKSQCYAESLKNALKEKEREITIFRNLQGLQASCHMSLPAASHQLEEDIQQLRVQQARLEAIVQQQAKTIEILVKCLQAT
ncbi:POTE ankyrin domain family member B-like [Pithys albifrons albifrons]|uniref:POTE ankyrin domain family member B-like n=1 Tax=Pithys albifrons albifrons TaxID=3385563 RepID=UPI003A5CF368